LASTAAPHGRTDGPGRRTPEPDSCPTLRVNLASGTPLVRRDATWPQIRGYEILSLIGTGGMGIVFKARHRDLNRTVALKLLRGAGLDDPEFRDRFRAEAEAVARLQHPNIIQVFETGTTDVADGRLPGPFIALEYVEGGSLARLADRAQEPRHAARIVAKLAAATAAAHQAGIVHRDLKPANILITVDGEPKIADFGLAKQVTDDRDESGRFLTQAGTIIGTPEYMAPEQAAGGEVTPAVDVYALGVILYELLTGRVPFQAATPIHTMALVRTQDPVSPRRLQPGVPRDLDTICQKCLEKDPARRYPSAEALGEDLQRFLDGRPIRARQVSDTERVVRWCRRNPLAAACLAGVVATFLIAFGLVSRSYWRAEDERLRAVAERENAEERERIERWARYQSNLRAAASALQVDNVAAARRELDAAPKEHRAWEWNHFYSRLDAATRVFGTEGDSTEGARLSVDGRRMILYHPHRRAELWDTAAGTRLASFVDPPELGDATVSPDGRVFANPKADHTIVLRDVEAGTVRCTLRGHTGPITSIQFFTDGSRVLTRADDKTVRLWDARTGDQLRKFEGEFGSRSVTIVSPDGRRVLMNRGGTRAYVGEGLELWDLETGARVAELPAHGHEVQGAVYSPNGRVFATIGDRGRYTVTFWDGRTGARQFAVEGHTNRMSAIAFSPDGARVATGSMDQTVILTDIASGKPIRALEGHRGWIWSLAFSPDGTRLVSASQDHTVRLWDGCKGTPVEILHGHTGAVWAAGYSADGRTILSAAADGTIRSWDARLVEADGVLRGHQSYVYDVAVHPDGKRVASASWDATARVWDTATGRQLAAFDHGSPKEFIVSGVAFHPAGRLLATRVRDISWKGRSVVVLWDLETGREVRRWAADSDRWRDTRLAFNADGTRLATGLNWNQVRVWDVDTGRVVADVGPVSDCVQDVAFRPDGRRLAAACHDGRVYVWETADWSAVSNFDKVGDGANAVAYSPDGRWLACGFVDGTVRVRDAETLDEVAVVHHPSKVFGLAFTPDGTRLACACLDNSIRLWDTGRWSEVAELRGHTDYVHAVTLTPDGTRLISGSGDRTVRVWDSLDPKIRSGRRP
jgi:WD40 repeat protein/tRNA A-37 threonylcarbamoyl transferase component Bud32